MHVSSTHEHFFFRGERGACRLYVALQPSLSLRLRVLAVVNLGGMMELYIIPGACIDAPTSWLVGGTCVLPAWGLVGGPETDSLCEGPPPHLPWLQLLPTQTHQDDGFPPRLRLSTSYS